MILFILSFCSIGYNLHGQCTNPPVYDDPASQNGILELMNIPCAWTISDGGPPVAILDFDLYDNHADL
ncbi:MAG TPA: hypothetical protein P5235_07340, partial [Saprospiraceae bacterium]|nr:hypothetical protein [Saprospiraceae bacterium]